MAVSHFIPSMWAAGILQPLDKALVYGQMGVINRNYEGEISAAGDTVRINAIGPITINDYVKNGTVSSPESLTDAQTVLVIDQQKYFNFYVDDIDRRQANVSFMMDATREAAYQLADTMDQFIAGEMGSAPGTHVYLSTAPADALGTEGKASDYIAEIQTELDAANVPTFGRWCIVPPFFIEYLRKDGNIVSSGAESADARLLNGQITRLHGIDIMMSNNVISSGTHYQVMAGYSGATTVAQQLNKVEAYRPESQFADAVKGLHMYGAKVVRPAGLVDLWVNKP